MPSSFGGDVAAHASSSSRDRNSGGSLSTGIFAPEIGMMGCRGGTGVEKFLQARGFITRMLLPLNALLPQIDIQVPSPHRAY